MAAAIGGKFGACHESIAKRLLGWEKLEPSDIKGTPNAVNPKFTVLDRKSAQCQIEMATTQV